MSQTQSDEPIFDIHEIPFSTRGAWFNLSPVTGLHTHSDRVHLVIDASVNDWARGLFERALAGQTGRAA